MGSKKESASGQVPGQALPFASAMFLIASVVAAYLGWISLTGHAAIGCGPESGCDKVLRSKFAYWLGIPVSLVAIPIYLATAVCAFRMKASPGCRRGWTNAICGSLLAIGMAIWFTAIQVFIVKALCRFCMSAHIAATIGAIVLLWARARMQQVAPVSWSQVGFATVVLLAVAMGGQFVRQPKTFKVSTIAAPQPAQPIPTNRPTVPVATSSPPARAAQGRVLAIYAGQFQLNASELPIIGTTAAPHLIVSLFDYTCHHCRTMHGVLLEVQRSFSNQLGIISLPMPLDPICNPIVKRPHPDHVNACEYARLGLAVWRARPAVYTKYDDWVFAPERPPSIEEAHRYATELVGVMPLQAALADPWVNEQIQRDIAIYDAAYRAGQGSMPQLIIGNKVGVGTMPIENVYQLLVDELGLKRQ